ncbi:MAG: hypothetical protein WCT19_02990 [Candidatus Paceibacterota bacterium]
MENKSTIISVIVFILAIVIAIFVLAPKGSGTTDGSGKYDYLAQCLADKKVTMYGAAWCSHCQAQKDAFEGSFKYVPYVECPDNIQQCLDLGVEGYPTWIFPDGQKLVGEQSLEKLASQSGCSLTASSTPNITSTSPTI